MHRHDACFGPAHELRDKIARQEVTAAETCEMIIERIEKANPVINAYCTTTFDLARAMARDADARARRGGALPALNGIPTSIKDLMQTAGVRTTYGSKVHEHFVPDEDDVTVARLKAAGIVMLGKTNTPEFGFSGFTKNKLFGATLNPWRLDRTPGGSSGGAAASVAAGMGPLALSSDGAGSIRHPACFCGVFGFKPTFGLVPIHPRIGIGAETITHYGPITRYVRDAAMMLDAMKGPHDLDRHSLPDIGVRFEDAIEEIPEHVKIGWTADLGWTKAIDPEVEAAVGDAVAKLSRHGWEVKPVKVKLKNPEQFFYTWTVSNHKYDHREHIKAWSRDMDPDLVRMASGGYATCFDYLRCIEKRSQFYLDMVGIYKAHDIDVLVTPTTATTAFGLDVMFPPAIDGKNVSPTGWMPFTFMCNQTGQPAATLPAGFSREGLPIGMQVIGRRLSDALVMQVSKAFEDVAPWQGKRPDL
ncbi:MAG: amidase [Candidatus Lokiarchaeota archaeon]|nr:amidase [Candidatus Lokiarchaeota archaeon]